MGRAVVSRWALSKSVGIVLNNAASGAWSKMLRSGDVYQGTTLSRADQGGQAIGFSRCSFGG
jgi:hypothetical protein